MRLSQDVTSGGTATYGYTAYGTPVTSMFTGADKNNATPSATSTTQPYSAYRFNAMRWDSTTGEYDMGFRNYDPSLNQFMSRDMYDSALSDTGLNADPFTGSRYAFGDGNSVSNTELDGHMVCIEDGPCGGLKSIEEWANRQEFNQALRIVNKAQAASSGGGGPSAGHDEAVAIAEAEIIVLMMNKYNLSPMDAFNGIELGKTIPGGSKYGNGKNGFADITFTHGNTAEIWEVKSSGVEDAQAVAAGEVQGYIRAYMAANPGKRAIPGESLPAPKTAPLGPRRYQRLFPARTQWRPAGLRNPLLQRRAADAQDAAAAPAATCAKLRTRCRRGGRHRRSGRGNMAAWKAGRPSMRARRYRMCHRFLGEPPARARALPGKPGRARASG